MKATWLLYVILAAALCPAQQDIISTYAGGGPNHVPATGANVFSTNVAVDQYGNFYIVGVTSQGGYRVFKVDKSGTLTVLAGNGVTGYSGDGGPATSALLHEPTGVAVDAAGDVYISDTYNERVRKVTVSTGEIATFAGNGAKGFAGDGGPARGAELNSPEALTVDSAGNLYIADGFNYRIRKVTASTGEISTIAGNGIHGYSGDGGPATKAELDLGNFLGISSDANGNVFLPDQQVCVVREVTTSGAINRVAGTPSNCTSGGDGGPAVTANLFLPTGVAVDRSGDFYVAEYLHVRKAALGGYINTVAGNGTFHYAGDDVPATGASLFDPQGVGADAAGDIYIADTGNCLIRKVTAGTGVLTNVAGVPATGQDYTGSNNCGDSGDGGPATSAEIYFPTRVAADLSGNLYINNTLFVCRVRKIDGASGVITTIAGNGTCGYAGDGSPAIDAEVRYVSGIAVDGAGNLYLAGQGNFVIRKVSAATGIITTVAGTGTQGFSGDGGPATSAELGYLNDVAAGVNGNVYIADNGNTRIRVVNTSGVINTVAGNGTCGSTGDGGPAIAAEICPTAIAVDAAGDLLIADVPIVETSNRVRWVDALGIIHTVAGTGEGTFSEDGGSALKATLHYPTGIAVDRSGNIFIADSQNARIREVSAIANLNSSAYSVAFGSQKVGTSTTKTITLTGVGPLEISGMSMSGTDDDFTETNNCPSSLESGGSCTVKVTFKPCSKGTKSGTLAVKTNGFFNPKVTVSVSGTGD